MLELSRTVRFSLNVGQSAPPAHVANNSRAHNSFAGWPSMVGMGAYYELEVRCRGEADPLTGYLMNISRIDDAVRRCAIDRMSRAFASTPQPSLPSVLKAVIEALQEQLHDALTAVRWRLTPHYHLTMKAGALDRVIISQQFEFAASHRLNCPSLSPQQNRATFGKCNNPSGHGHNYRIQVNVQAALGADGSSFSLQSLEEIVDRVVIQRFDHKHLNLDTAEFATLNPSVENIAKVCYDLLAPEFKAMGESELASITVWETEKTSCTYPG